MNRTCLGYIKNSRLILYTERVAVCSEIPVEHVNVVCGEIIKDFIGKPGGTQCHHWAP